MREAKGKVMGEYGLDTEYGLHLTEENRVGGGVSVPLKKRNLPSVSLGYTTRTPTDPMVPPRGRPVN